MIIMTKRRLIKRDLFVFERRSNTGLMGKLKVLGNLEDFQECSIKSVFWISQRTQDQME